ncbi:hypothetical protein [Cryobacterium sp. AP23]
MTQTFDVPADWLPGTASRKPLVLVNAFAFAKSSTPPPDQWLYFAKLRPVPWRLVATYVVITAICLWGLFGMIGVAGSEIGYVLFPLIVLGVGALFFGWAAVMSIVSYGTRTGWPHLHGVGIGASGIALRFTGGDADVSWEAVTSIGAVFTNAANPRKAQIPVLRVMYAETHVDLNAQILGASPILILIALTYFWKHPESRSELSTSAAQKRMTGWLGQVAPH